VNENRTFRPAVGAFAIAVLALIVFAPGLRDGFAYDDVPIILGDPRIRSLANLPAIFTGGYWHNAQLALYRPLTTLSFAIDWSLAGESAAWFHFTNILLNATAAVLVFLLLARLFRAGPAFLAAAVFAVHPVHVEAVTNVVGRAELLAAVFFFAACLVWIRDTRQPRGWILPSLFFLLALLGKESAIMLPAAFLLLDGATARFRDISWKEFGRRHWRGYTALLVVAIVYLLVRMAVLGGLTPTRVDPLLEVAATPGQRILTVLQAWPVWLKLLAAPVTLLADYGPAVLEPATGATSGSILGLAILAFLVVGGIVLFALRYHRIALILLWLPATILPVSNLVVPIGVIVAERTLYIPSLVVALGIGLVAGMGVFRSREPRLAGLAALGLLVALFAIRTVTRIPDWQSTDTVMEALVRDRPDSFRGHWHLARMARASNDMSAAVAQYDTAMALWPRRKTLVVEAASFAVDQGDLRRALALTTLAARQWPDDVEVLRMLAGVALDTNDVETAERAIRDGLRVQPDDDMLRRMSAALDSIRRTR
jgi:protein O-mannosyl-transferase